MAGVIGANFRGTLLYLQRVRNEMKCSEMSVSSILECISSTENNSAGPFIGNSDAGSFIDESSTQSSLAGCSSNRDVSSSPNNRKLKIDNYIILKTSLHLKIVEVRIYSVPLIQALHKKANKKYLIHTFVVFKTVNPKKKRKEMWWSLEKLTDHILLQHSRKEHEVRDFRWDKVTETCKERDYLQEIKKETKATMSQESLKDLLKALLNEDLIIDPYNVYMSNCQQFASFVFNKINREGVKWEAPVTGRTFKLFFKLWFANYSAKIRNRNDHQNDEHEQNLTQNVLKWHRFFKILQRWVSNKGKEPLQLDEQVNYNRETDGSILHFALLGMASKKKGKQIVRKLLESELADCFLEALNDNGETPLLLAVKLKCPTKIFTLILNKSLKKIDHVDKFGSTPLHYAIHTHSVEKTKLLLDLGANVDVETNDDVGRQTPLHLTAKWWNKCPESSIEKLVTPATLDKVDQRGYTALQQALESKNDRISQHLLRNGANVNINHEENGAIGNNAIGVLPIFLVAKWPNIPNSQAETIIEKSKKEINQFDEEGYTPLHWALKTGSMNIIAHLLDNGATCEISKDAHEDTVLHLMARLKDWPADWIENNELLLKLAERFRNLWKEGTKVASNKDSSSRQNFDTDSSQSDDLLSVFNKQGYCALHTAVISDNLLVVKVLLKCGTDVNCPTNEPIKKKSTSTENTQHLQRNPIHLAAMYKRVSLDMVKLLIDRDANVRANVESVDSSGFTPFLWALKTKHTEKSKLFLGITPLVKYHPDIKWEHSPLHLISKCWANCPIDFIQKLVDQYKDNINARDQHGHTPLYYAQQNKIKSAEQVRIFQRAIANNVQ